MKKLFLMFVVAMAFAACGGSKAKEEAKEQEVPVIEETIIEEEVVVDTTAVDTLQVQELDPVAE
ncbi:MAG: hypothetical protein LBH80_02480 [Prevotellaceae bacterium]|jgi:uncharacterized protein YcfL|nr:hypothetical protein [Prevotellaceae bacterium]